MWIGIYSNFREIKVKSNIFDTIRFIQKQKELMKTVVKGKHSLLVEYYKKLNNKETSIIDYGGALGAAYLTLLKCTRSTNINYNIIETPAIVREGKKLNTNIKFYSRVPDRKFDIVYSRSSLQYSTDWKKVINSLVSCNAVYMIFTCVPVGQVKTFLTLQDKKMPYWFINEDEFLNFFDNYTLILKRMNTKLKTHNFKIPYALQHSSDYVFERKK